MRLTIEKYASRRVMTEIGRVLREVWDPINLKGYRQTSTSYVGDVYELLVSGASDDQINEHLWLIVTERMGLSGATKEDMAETVTALRKIPLHDARPDP